MKKNYFFALIVLLFCVNVHAQYKKASFLNTKGRTYDFGGTAHFLSEGNAIAPGIIYSFGRQREEKRPFHWFDLEILLPAKFHYTTEDIASKTPVTVSGKAGAAFIFRYNFAYYLVNNTSSAKLLPFVTAGAHITATGGELRDISYTPDTYSDFDIKKTPVHSNLNLGANLGLGGIYNITSKFGLKITGGYSYQYNHNSQDMRDGQTKYNFFSSHPYATLGVRFTMAED